MNSTATAVVDASLEMLVERLSRANHAYRNGLPLVMTDAEYDHHIAELKAIAPDHPFLHQVEPEADFGAGKVRHRRPMLSTDKAYTEDELEAWIGRIKKACQQAGVDPAAVRIVINAKLDGMAGRFENNVLASRGDGLTGNDITHMIGKGLLMEGEGDGEIVLNSQYFSDNLSESFEHPRNVVTGAVGADTLRDVIAETIQDGAMRFVAYSTLPFEELTLNQLAAKLPDVRARILAQCPYPVDGLILAVDNLQVREVMGSTGHHHNWQLAAKTVGETAETEIMGITWQVGRTGRLTPVLNVKPVRLSGATVSNATAHHAGNVQRSGMGVGAVVELVRSGEVIPKVLAVTTPTERVSLPTCCPCCDAVLKWVNDFLVCENLNCADRAKARMLHFFHILGSIDLFGPKTCEVLVDAGITDLLAIFDMKAADFEALGFGPGQAQNLEHELASGLVTPVDDFRLLAAFGLEHLGRGDSKKLLAEVPLGKLRDLTVDRILAIKGFGAITSEAIYQQLVEQSALIDALAARFTAIIPTPLTREKASVDSPIAGKHIVFTGTMVQGNRDDMKKQAEALGATNQSSVNKKTDYLVAGEKVGAKKIEKARELGVTVLNEQEYLDLING